jgi:hypothetical protein
MLAGMAYILIRQKFADYETWREAFDSLAAQREKFGLEAIVVGRNAEDDNEAIVLFGYPPELEVQKHVFSEALRQAHQRGGVVEGSTQITYVR